MVKKPELLAPAGDLNIFKAAINAGCDAVYLAGDRFGARAYAKNFSRDELVTAIGYAHIFGVKVYLTVNTLIKQNEIDGLADFVRPFFDAGLDGVIVQDLGAIRVLHKAFPSLHISASTQMTLTGCGAEILKHLGVQRIIPARELSLEEIKRLKEDTKMEVEVFVHGAMCYSYSGQCLFSCILGDRSANRGRCAAPCRMEYSYKDNKKYMLSLKDMCLIEHISKLCEANIDSFKIEGRMKPAEYVAGITYMYRKYIDLYYKNKDVKIDEFDRRLLSSVYVRSLQKDGYLMGKKGPDMISLDSPAYTSSDEECLSFIREKIIAKERKLGIDAKIILKKNEPVKLFIKYDKNNKSFGENNTLDLQEATLHIELSGQQCQQAKSAPLVAESISEVIRKTGGTVFKIESLDIEMDEDVFVPVGAVKELRREALNRLYEEILYKYKN